jgi:uncharacterized protein YbbK (DUF523 family)
MSTDSIDGRSRQESILASACLGGVECKYNGTSAGQMPSKADLEGVTLACPEELGGLGPHVREPRLSEGMDTMC